MSFENMLFYWIGWAVILSILLVILCVCCFYVENFLYAKIENWWLARRFVIENFDLFKKWYKNKYETNNNGE